MKRKYSLLTFLLALFATASIAQSSIGVQYYYMGEYDAAKIYFEKQLGSNPAEANFYLGEIAYAQGKFDDAKGFYAKGLAANPEYIKNKIGEAKVTLKTNAKAADDILTSILKNKAYRKNAEVLIAVARAYYEGGVKDKALSSIELARKGNSKFYGIYILEGDMQAKASAGEAAGKYEQAIHFAPKEALGYLKSAKIYETIRPTFAIEKLNTVLGFDSNNVLAYKYLGEINTSTGRFNDAIVAYERFFSMAQYKTPDDIARYSSVLYFLERYDDALALITEGLAQDAEHYVLNRFYLYCLISVKDFEKAVVVAEKFFSIQTDRERIAKDYSSYATALKETKQFEKALEQYNKAIEVDKSSALNIYAEIADLYRNAGESGKAAEAYKGYIEARGENVEARDYYQLGSYYYQAGTVIDSSKVDVTMIDQIKADFLAKADEAFSVVIERLPDSFTGYLWRARTQASLDPETTEGLAKPYYEKLIEVLLSKGEPSNSMLIESYKYMGYYYYLKEEKENSIGYWEKILEISPSDPTAIMVLGELRK